MKIGMITDSLGELSFDDLLGTAAELGIERLEFAAGNWSRAPHLTLDRMLDSAPAREEFMVRLRDHGLSISRAQLLGQSAAPGRDGSAASGGHAQDDRARQSSGGRTGGHDVGLPGRAGDANANWVTTSWPPETQTILRYQWEEVLIPYWRELVAYCRGLDVGKLCLELHGHQNVYSVSTFFRLRDAVGETVGVNFDPSHLLWMGADPLAAIAALGSAIYHVHAKDTRLEPEALALDGRIEIRPAEDFTQRAWNYVTLGRGHDEAWWRRFCQALAAIGYDDVLSIEHEDLALPPIDGVKQSVGLLRRVVPGAAA